MEAKFKPGDLVRFKRYYPQEKYKVIESLIAPSGVLSYVIHGPYPGYKDGTDIIVPFYDITALDEPIEMTPQEKHFYSYYEEL